MSTTTPPKSAPARAIEPLREAPPKRGEIAAQWRETPRGLVDFAGALWARRGAILGTGALASAAAFVWVLGKPDTFISDATLMVTGSQATSSIAEAARSYLTGTGAGYLDVTNAAKILTSREVARRALERRTRSTATDSAAVEAVAASVWTLPDEHSTAIKVRYRASTPDQAQAVLKALTEEAIAVWDNVMAPKESRSFLNERLKSARAEEEAGRKELNEFLSKTGATDYSAELHELAGGLAKLSIEIEVWRSTLESHKKEVTELEKELARTEELVVVGETESLKANSAVEGLRSEVARREAEIKTARLSGAPTKHHEEIIKSLQASIAELEGKSAEKVPVHQRGPNPTWVTLKARLTDKTTEMITLSAKLPSQEEYLRKGRARLEDLRKLQTDADRLQDKVKMASDSIKRIDDALRSFDVNQDLSSRGLTSLRIVEPANLPLASEGPQRARLALGALAGALFCAASFVLARVRFSKAMLRGEHARYALMRIDVVPAPWLEAGHVQRFAAARRRGWE